MEYMKKVLTRFTGTDEPEFKWWSAVFERKILRGYVGMPLRYSSCHVVDFLWELEFIINDIAASVADKEEERRTQGCPADQLAEKPQTNERPTFYSAPLQYAGENSSLVRAFRSQEPPKIEGITGEKSRATEEFQSSVPPTGSLEVVPSELECTHVSSETVMDTEKKFSEDSSHSQDSVSENINYVKKLGVNMKSTGSPELMLDACFVSKRDKATSSQEESLFSNQNDVYPGIDDCEPSITSDFDTLTSLLEEMYSQITFVVESLSEEPYSDEPRFDGSCSDKRYSDEPCSEERFSDEPCSDEPCSLSDRLDGKALHTLSFERLVSRGNSSLRNTMEQNTNYRITGKQHYKMAPMGDVKDVTNILTEKYVASDTEDKLCKGKGDTCTAIAGVKEAGLVLSLNENHPLQPGQDSLWKQAKGFFWTLKPPVADTGKMTGQHRAAGTIEELEETGEQPRNTSTKTDAGIVSDVDDLVESVSEMQQRKSLLMGSSVDTSPVVRMLPEDTADPGTPSFTSQTGRARFLEGDAAYRYYQLLRKGEAVTKVVEMKAQRDRLLRKFQGKHETLMHTLKLARDYYSNPTEVNRSRWKKFKSELKSPDSQEDSNDEDVRSVVPRTPDYRPYFTTALVIVQLITLSLLWYRYGLAPLGVNTRRAVNSDIPTFLGTETFVFLQEPNPWVGPPVQAFLDAGAALSTCIRPSEFLEELAASNVYSQLDLAVPGDRFGCCEMGSYFNTAGTTAEDECRKMTMGLGNWVSGTICSKRRSGRNSVAHVIKPCCAGLTGACVMVSHEHCLFVHGHFFVDMDHCVQVNCLGKLCSAGGSVSNTPTDPGKPWLKTRSSDGWQWWRLFSSIPHTHGVLHLLALLVVELLLLLPLEITAGWHRVLVVFVLSSVAGQMMGCAVESFQPQEGGTPGIMGVVGVAVLELAEAWRFIKKPLWEAAKLLALICLFMGMGTLHLISLASSFTGLVVGMIACVQVMPYITLGFHLGKRRLPLVILSTVLQAIVFTALYFTLRSLQNFQQCSQCFTPECIRYTPLMCRTYYVTPWGISY
ncbi:uncharacterized protein LOC101855789 [Aplysia californica]|uniref:Uncharacterized protein LOC101855789 n=1 Tax=Aplysia californica TaxID=6500 RepID=A0ABM0ZZN0_APLCA|nr:uncharacterized protein LOC101855789 [Aplysia californica]